MTAQREWTIGPNAVHFEPPDLLIVRFKRTMSIPDAQELIRVIFEVGDAHGALYLIGVVEPGYVSSPEVRSVYNKVDRKYPVRYVAMVSTSFAVRIISNMIMRAARILAPGRLDFPVEFIATEEIARARIAALRNET